MDIIYYLYFDEIPNTGYVGKSSEDLLKRRMYQHKSCARIGGKNSKLYNWLRKYMAIYELKCAVILHTDNHDLHERLIIAECKKRNINLKNTALGGEGIKRGFKHSDAVRLNASKRNKEFGRFVGPANPFYGKTGDANHKSKHIYQYDLNGVFLMKYESHRLAAKSLEGRSVDNNRLISRATKTGEIAYGFLWSNELKSMTPKQYTHKTMTDKDILYCFNEIKAGRSRNSLHKELGFSRHQITKKVNQLGATHEMP